MLHTPVTALQKANVHKGKDQLNKNFKTNQKECSFLSLERQLRLDQKEKCKQAASQNYAKEHIFTPAGMTLQEG